MTIKAVVSHYPSQIGMACEKNAEQIVDFALVPVGAIVEAAEGRHWRGLIGVCLHPYARVVSDGQEVVHDLEALVFGGVVYSSDIRDLGVFGCCVILEESEERDNTGWWNMNGELIFPDGESSETLAGE
jgi:hypothetical protein